MDEQSLLKRVNEASGPSLDLDHAVHDLWPDGDGAPLYSASIDAALALVRRVFPEASWICGANPTGGNHAFMAELFRTHYISGVIPRLSYATGATPALALLAAVLSAAHSQG